MQRDIGFVTNNPTVVGCGRNVKEITGPQFVNLSVFKCGGCRAGEDKSQVFNFAASQPESRSDVLAPFPTGLVSRPPDRHVSDLDNLESALWERANFIWFFESFQN